MNSTQLPDGYSEYKSIDLAKNKSEMLTVNLAALLLGAVMVVPAALLMPFPEIFDNFIQHLPAVLLFFASLILYVLLHEAVHGIFMKRYSKVKPFYGLKGIMYAYAGSTAFFDKRSYLVISLAPVVLLGLVLVLLNLLVPLDWFWFVYIIQVVNISGAAGDLYVMNMICKCPDDILVNDSGVSMKIYSASAI